MFPPRICAVARVRPGSPRATRVLSGVEEEGNLKPPGGWAAASLSFRHMDTWVPSFVVTGTALSTEGSLGASSVARSTDSKRAPPSARPGLTAHEPRLGGSPASLCFGSPGRAWSRSAGTQRPARDTGHPRHPRGEGKRRRTGSSWRARRYRPPRPPGAQR